VLEREKARMKAAEALAWTIKNPLIPAEAGTQAFSPQLFVQITPARIEPLDQLDLPRSIPFFKRRSRRNAVSRLSWASYQTSLATPYLAVKPFRTFSRCSQIRFTSPSVEPM
jgi:hypothetical protein